MEVAAGESWMRGALMDSVRDALDRAWVLDIDATIKPLYGRQEGAEVGYNPHKRGCLSHVLHTFWIGNLRLVLDAVLTGGKQHTSGHAKAALRRLLDDLGKPSGSSRGYARCHTDAPGAGAYRPENAPAHSEPTG